MLDSIAVVTVGVNGISNTSSITAMTYGGVPMTLEGFENFDGRIVAVYTLANPPVGTNTVFIDVSGTRDITICAASYANVDQSDAFDNLQGGSGQSNNISNTLDCEEGSAIIDHFVVDDENATPSSGQTIVHFETNDNGAERLYSSFKVAGPGLDTLQWTIGNAAEYTYLYGCLRAVPALPDAQDDSIDGSSLSEPGDMLNIDPLVDNGNGIDDFGDDGPGTTPILLIDPATGNAVSTITTPNGGTVTVNDGGTPNNPTDDTFDYTAPNTANAAINESFEYQICDSSVPSDCDTATVTFSVTTPVTLSSTASEMVGDKVKVDWTTSSELFNVGYQLWGLDGKDQKWEKLHNWLVKSGSGNAAEPQSYSKTVKVPGSIKQLIAVGISSVDSDGSEHYYGPFELGQRYGSLSDLEPIAWDHIRDEVDRAMADKGYVKDRVNGYRKVTSSSTTGTASSNNTESVIEMTVRESGMVRLSSSELASAGLDLTHTKNREIAVLDHRGDPVVRYVLAKGTGSGLNKTLGSSGDVYFHASAPEGHAAIYSEVSHYRLVIDPAHALVASVQKKQGVSSGFSTHHREQLRIEVDQHYTLSAQADDPWVERIMTAQPSFPLVASKTVTLPGDVDQSQGVSLLIGVGRSSQLPAITDQTGHPTPEHVIRGAVADTQGNAVWLEAIGENGRGVWHSAIPIPVELGDVKADTEDLEVNIGAQFSVGAGYPFSVMQLDYMGLDYARGYTAKGNDHYISFEGPHTGETGYQVTVPEAGYALAFAYSDGNLVRLLPESQVRQTTNGNKQRVVNVATLNGAGTQSIPVNYWISGKRGYLSPERLRLETVPTKASVLAQAQGANSLLIAYSTFNGPALAQYAQHQQTRGLSPAIIDYATIVKAYGGQTGPGALTQYLSEVEHHYGNLYYVLLIGSSVYDHLDRLDTGSMTFIPGHYGESNYSRFTVSDVPYVTDSNGDLFASIGRWPVRSDAELSAIIAKSMRWADTDHSSGDALLIAEHTVPGENINFGAALNNNLEPQLPSGWSNHKIYVDKIMENDPSLSLTQALARAKTRVITQLNDTPDVVVYNGHATTSQLSNKGLFKSGDVGDIDTPGAELWIPMSCYVTYYESTHVNTLAHQLMSEGNAVGITGAMLLSNQGSNISAGRTILNGMLNDGKSLGGAVNAYKQAQGNAQFNVNWSVLGDSSLRMNQ